ncbi:MAG TPA: hypothetical protein VKV16_03770, partial [Solirubrobacteraceae bacterium]|nr:hypothetical protein [Solirubrobacteraceae bacterium]
MAASRIELPVPAARVDDEREDHARAGHASPGERHESPGEHESSGAFLRRAEVRDVLAWMRLLADPHDAAAIVRALARPPIELHQVELARVIQVARRRKLGLVLGLAAATESPHIPPEARERIQRFLDLHASFAGELDVAAPDELLATLVRRLRAPARALLAARDAAEHDAGLERLQELAREFVREFPRASARELARHLATVAPGAGERRGANTGTPAPTTASSRSEGQAGTGGHAGAGSEARGGGVAGADGVAGVSGEAGAGGVAGAGGEAGTGGETGARADAADGERANGVGDEALDDQTAERELHDAFQLLREEVLDAVARIGGRLGELRLDTDLDISHGVARYLELLKVSAALQRPAGQSLADALADVNTRLLAAVTPLQREILQTSPLDAALVRAAEPGAPVAAGGEGASTLTPREQRSLTPFLPRRGTGLALSASDIHTYRSCPLRYKFARVLRIPL